MMSGTASAAWLTMRKQRPGSGSGCVVAVLSPVLAGRCRGNRRSAARQLELSLSCVQLRQIERFIPKEYKGRVVAGLNER